MNDLKRLAKNNTKGNPFSAKIVEESTGRTITAVNEVLVSKDPTAHAEIMAIRKAGEQGFNFRDSVIYCSGEPCPMCATAIAWSGIKKVYYHDSYKVANNGGFAYDQDVHQVNKYLKLGLDIKQVKDEKDKKIDPNSAIK
jgi:tRNA(Arg) A34 adenosine deaminase TadA